MANITFITPDGTSITVSGHSGSVMELALDYGIEGILGNCGGVCSCGTCHVHVAPDDLSKTGEASEIERDMLELDDGADAYSRLCCQIEVSEAIDGIVLRVAR